MANHIVDLGLIAQRPSSMKFGSLLLHMFPAPDEIQGIVTRDRAVSLLCRTLEASRAAVDEITSGAQRVLSVDEQMELGIVAERTGARHHRSLDMDDDPEVRP